MNAYQVALELASTEWGQIVLNPETYSGPIFKLEADAIVMGLNPLENEPISVRIPTCAAFETLAVVELTNLVGASDQSGFERLYAIAAKYAGLR